MKFKFSKKIIRWVILFLVLFLVGFTVAKVLSSTNAEDSSGVSSDSDKIVMVEKEVDYRAIIVIFTLIMAVLGFGYYKEKKKQIKF